MATLVQGPMALAVISFPFTLLLMAGVDFRLTRALGFGPVLDLSAATYSSLTTELNGAEVPSASGEISPRGDSRMAEPRGAARPLPLSSAEAAPVRVQESARRPGAWFVLGPHRILYLCGAVPRLPGAV
jgi:hypothetical protein